ncbi:MAG TPA: hypothetical protein IAD50_06280 [Candidatus Egerieisoma faecipullorum]|uniref:Uncharacterized protein n=1 Tax=Candidatus Egerieisoma faecipullorum TaxID=2840963 RepID=A0A9D1L9F5_9CLOT|nr:hypothetical protein [Candidatus Egerieisoma faecipullorum]
MKIDVGQFLDSVPIMLKGFLGVFIILGIIIVVTVLLNAVTKKGEKNVRSILLCSVVLLAVVGAAVAFALL